MNIEAILTVLLRYLPNLSLRKSMSLAAELKALSYVPHISVPRKALVLWIVGYVATTPGMTRDRAANRRIETIKAMREAFVNESGFSLSLKDAKEAVDEYGRTYGYTAF